MSCVLVSAGALHVERTSGPSAGAIKFGMAFSKANPAVVYVDRFKSVDAGLSWKELAIPAEAAVNNLAVSPKNPDYVLLASRNVVFKSADGAATWKEIGALGPHPEKDGGWKGQTISALSFHPGDERIVFAGTTHGGLFKSSNAGETWEDVSGKLGITSVVSRIAFNPKKHGEIFVSTGSWYWSSLVEAPKKGGGLFKSSDGGESFKKLSSQFENDLVQDVDAIGDTVYASVHHNPDSKGGWRAVFKSGDGGRTWKKLLENTFTMTQIAVNPEDEKHVVVSASDEVPFLISRDGGDSWQELSFNDSEHINYAHELEFADGRKVYAQDYYKSFMKSADGGNSWKWSAQGIWNSRITSLNVHPGNRNAVIASTVDGAVHTTYDGGGAWNRFLLKELGGIYWAAMEFHPQEPDTIYYGASGASDPTTGRYFGGFGEYTGLYISNDAGKTVAKASGLKHPLTHNSEQLEIYDVLVHPKEPKLIIVATSSEGVYRSTDRGKTWQDSNNGIPKQGFYWNLNFEDEAEDEIEAECRKEFEQHGENSRKPNCFYYATRTSMNLFANPHDKNEIWYTTLNGVFVSKDQGKNWQWLSDDLKNIHTHFMAFDPQDPLTIYVGTHQGAIDEKGKIINSSKGLLISGDGGKTWKQAENGPGAGYDIRAVAVSPENPAFVAVGTQSHFFVSTDKGRTWKKTTEQNLEEANELRIDATAKIIYLGTAKAGVWRGVIDYEAGSEAQPKVTGVLAPQSAVAAQEFDVIVSLDNTGGKPGSFELKIEAGGKKVSKTVELPTAGARAEKFSVSLGEAGEHDLLVNGVKQKTITVAQPQKGKPEKTLEQTFEQTQRGEKQPEPQAREQIMPQEKQLEETQLGRQPAATQENPQQAEKGFLEILVNAIQTLFKNLFG